MTAFDNLTERLRELVPEGYASIHPNEYWEKDKGNPMPYPRPLGLLEHSELEDYLKFLEGFDSAESHLKHSPNLSEEDFLHHALEVTNNPVKDWNEDMRQALSNERLYRQQEQHVDAQRRGNLFGGGWLPEGLANPEHGVLYSQSFQDLNRSLDDSFEEAWDLTKVDFRLDRPKNVTSLGYSSRTPKEYKYRVPTGYDSEGNLTYSPRDRTTTDRSWVRLPNYWYRERGDETPSSIENKTAQRIMDTIVHEAMHDADTDIGSPARNAGYSTKGPSFGHRTSGHLNFRSPPKGYKNLDFIPPSTRDHNLAAETMAYVGEYPDRPDIANIQIMDHSQVAPTDVKWMYDKLPTTPVLEGWRRSYKNTPKNMKKWGRRPIIQRDDEGNITNTFREDFVVPKSEQIRRNLVNALRDTAMTRMAQSGEFLENPETSQTTWERKRRRPNPKQVKMAERETSKARNAINRYWKKIEAGDEPLPNSFEDLPDKIKQLVGQQQIRSIVGEQRGLGSIAEEIGDPYEVAYSKLADVLNFDKDTREYGSSWKNMPFEERESALREYLDFVQTNLKPAGYTRYGDRTGFEIGESYRLPEAYPHSEIFRTEPDMDKIREDGHDSLDHWKIENWPGDNYPRLNVYQNLLDEFNVGGWGTQTGSDLETMLNDFEADWKKTTPGKIHEITPIDISNRARNVFPSEKYFHRGQWRRVTDSPNFHKWRERR